MWSIWDRRTANRSRTNANTKRGQAAGPVPSVFLEASCGIGGMYRLACQAIRLRVRRSSRLRSTKCGRGSESNRTFVRVGNEEFSCPPVCVYFRTYARQNRRCSRKYSAIHCPCRLGSACAGTCAHQLGMLNCIPQLKGMSPWILMDFRSPNRPLASIQDEFDRKGLISDQGRKKLALYVLQKAYKEKTVGKPE